MVKVYFTACVILFIALVDESALGQSNVPIYSWYGCLNDGYTFRIDVMEEEQEFFLGTIHYDQLNKPFEISGQLKNKELIIHELDDHMNLIGKYAFILHDQLAQGIWTNREGNIGLACTMSRVKERICPQLFANKYIMSGNDRPQGVLWLTPTSSHSKTGRFWDAEKQQMHHFYSFSRDSVTHTYCDSSDWSAYDPVKDPFVLKAEIVYGRIHHRMTENLMFDAIIYEFDQVFADSCERFVQAHLEQRISKDIQTERPSAYRWKDRIYVLTDLDQWNSNFICGSLELVGPEKTLDGFCFIYDRKNSVFRKIEYFMKSKYTDASFFPDKSVEEMGISVDTEGLLLKGYFNPVSGRPIERIPWKSIKKQFKNKLLEDLKEIK